MNASDRNSYAAPLSLCVAGWLIVVSGCSILSKPPTETLANAESSMRAAREARADELATADLRGAREKLTRANRAMADKNYDQARRLAESAQVEAELAEAKAEAAVVSRAAESSRAKRDIPPTAAELESRKP
jgi:regulator of protease activity HflC (stomatin/prohibitin superfamily)